MGWLSTLLEKQPNPFPVLSAEGRMFNASAAAVNTTVTGATAFANTDPTFLLDVPTGTVAIPAYMGLCQAGTVAGGAVSVLMEVDNADRYSSGGTAATVLNKLTTGGKTNLCSLYSATGSAIVATNAYGNRIMGLLTAQDVAPAEGAIQEIVWTPTSGIELLVGPAALIVYTYAGTTGPTWFYSFSWAEVPANEL